MDRFEDEATAELRQWARGMLPLEAATELLIRSGWAGAGQRWVNQENGGWWIDFAAIPDQIGGLSGGEKRFLRIAASIAGELAIRLDDELAGLDRDHADLVLAAVAHTAGFTTPSSWREPDGNGGARTAHAPSLYQWPSTAAVV